jgi:hypothetical protein
MSNLDGRTQRLEQRVLILASLCGALVLALVLVVWAYPVRYARAAESSTVLHAKGLIIEDEQDRARIPESGHGPAHQEKPSLLNSHPDGDVHEPSERECREVATLLADLSTARSNRTVLNWRSSSLLLHRSRA